LLLYLFQDALLFHPTPVSPDHRYSFDQPFTELNIPHGKDNLNIVRFPAAGKTNGIVLFFHGNRYNVEHYKKYVSLFTDQHWELWMIDYPGFGKTTGTRKETSFYEEARLMYTAARKTGYSRIIIYGKSIGTGVASYLASELPCERLLLETPYYSINALARHYFPIYPAALMTRYKFPNERFIGKMNCPLHIFHGTEDEIVPYAQGKKLADEKPGAELITINNGKHNNLSSFPLFRRKLDSLLLIP
jgi:pimeloyl-ACP methyl ester carboxylesterase